MLKVINWQESPNLLIKLTTGNQFFFIPSTFNTTHLGLHPGMAFHLLQRDPPSGIKHQDFSYQRFTFCNVNIDRAPVTRHPVIPTWRHEERDPEPAGENSVSETLEIGSVEGKSPADQDVEDHPQALRRENNQIKSEWRRTGLTCLRKCRRE